MKTISERLSDTTARQLLALLRQGASRQPTWADDDLSAILRYQLACPVKNAIGSRAAADQTFLELLTSRAPDLEWLRVLHRFAKASRSSGDSALPSPAATVLYYTTIAAALVRCHCRITRLSDRKLREGLEWSAARPWIDESIRSVLEDALKAMHAQRRKTP